MTEKLATQADARKPWRDVKSWRDVLKIHPAAELFPLISAAELKELAEDIKNHGLQTPIVIWDPADDVKSQVLLDGRNRLDALELLGLLGIDDEGELCLNKWWNEQQWIASDRYGAPLLATNHLDLRSGDPYAVALSLNVHRRHLTAEQKRDLIAKVLKAKPEASNLQIAKQVKVDDKTIAKVRAVLEARSEIPNVKARTDTKGRKQPASKVKTAQASNSTIKHVPPDDAYKSKPAASAEVSIEQRKAEMAALAGTSATDPKPVKEINAFHRQAVGFVQDFTQRFKAWYATRPAIDKDGKAALMQALYLCADEFARLAQELDGRPDLVIQDDLSIPDCMRRGMS